MSQISQFLVSVFNFKIVIFGLSILDFYCVSLTYYLIDSSSMCLTMTCKSVLKDHNGNKRNHFLFFVSSLVVIGKPWNIAM